MSEPIKSGFGTAPGFTHFVDSEIGMTMQETKVEEIRNGHGQHYWKVTAQIGTLFGSEVEGELTGIGATKERALERLAEERKKLNDSLWE